MNSRSEYSYRAGHYPHIHAHDCPQRYLVPPPPPPMPSPSSFTASRYAKLVNRECYDSEYDVSYRYNYYPESSVRDEPYHPTPRNATSSSSREVVSPVYPPLTEECLKYQKTHARPLYLGVMTDHTITMEHPLVDLYLSLVSPKPNYILVPHENPDMEEPEAPSFNALFRLDKPLSPLEEEIIFVLAACKLYGNQRHPKHFTFWSELVWERTMARVHSMLESDTPRICVDIAYIDLCILQSRQCEASGTDTLPPWSKFRQGPAVRQTRNAAARATGKKREAPNSNTGKELEASGSGPKTAAKRKQPAKVANKSRKKVKIAEPEPSSEVAEVRVEINVTEPTEPDTNLDITPTSSESSPSTAPTSLEPTTTREAKLERMGSPSLQATLAELPELGLSPLKATSPAPKSRANRSRRVPVASVPVVAPSRRSARQAHKQASTEETPPMDVDELPSATSSATSSPSTLSSTSTSTISPATTATSPLPTSISMSQEAVNGHKRSRSSSSAMSASSGTSTSTAVSSTSEGGLSTAVEEDGSPLVPVKGLELTVDEADEKPAKSKGKTNSRTRTKDVPKAKTTSASRSNKRKRVDEEEQENAPEKEEEQVVEPEEKEEQKPKRVSTRARKGTAKVIESKAIELKMEKTEKPPAKKARTSSGAVSRSRGGKKVASS